MDQERSRIQADLRGQIAGEVHCDDLTLQLYSTDASIHQLRPLGVIYPTGTDDVVQCVQYAAENHLTIHPRGSGSNFSGCTLGEGLILDFSYSMRRVLEVGDGHIRVQPGAILAHVNHLLSRQGQIFGPDPINRSITTLGGVVSLNSSGSHWLQYGSPRDKVINMEIVLADGQIIQTGHADTIPPALVNDLTMIRNRRREMIQRAWPDTPLNNAGYDLAGLLTDDHVDIARLLCGSEGTLGIITRLTLQTEEIPANRGVVMLFFDRLDTAAKAAVEIIEQGVAACDLLDRRLLSIARDVDPRYQRLIPPHAESMVFVEFQAEDSRQLSEQIDRLVDRYVRRKKRAFDSRSTTQTRERNFLWQIVRRAIPRLYKLKGRRRALPFVDDYVVRPETLPQLLVDVQAMLNRHDVTASFFAHIGQGAFRVYPLLDLSNPEHIKKMSTLGDELHERVIACGGTISGSHGDGLTRTKYLRRQYGRVYDVMSEIKNVFDPQRTLNPGIIVDTPRREWADTLRLVTLDQSPVDGHGKTEVANRSPAHAPNSAHNKNSFETKLDWDAHQVMLATRNCNGCARCRTTSPAERMCPIFRILPREEASPRAKANLMRGILSGTLDESHLKSEDLNRSRIFALTVISVAWNVQPTWTYRS